jgi:hypothetical protein
MHGLFCHARSTTKETPKPPSLKIGWFVKWANYMYSNNGCNGVLE